MIVSLDADVERYLPIFPTADQNPRQGLHDLTTDNIGQCSWWIFPLRKHRVPISGSNPFWCYLTGVIIWLHPISLVWMPGFSWWVYQPSSIIDCILTALLCLCQMLFLLICLYGLVCSSLQSTTLYVVWDNAFSMFCVEHITTCASDISWVW